MKPLFAANLSLFLTVVGCYLVVTGEFLSHHAMPRPDTLFEDVVGRIMLITSLWLSGFAFHLAKRRALYALAAFLLALVIMQVGSWV